MEPKNRLLIISRDAPRYARLIRKRHLPDLSLSAYEKDGVPGTDLETCTIILGEPDHIAPHLRGAKNLRWVQSAYAGVEVLLGPELRTDYLLTRVSGPFGPSMSEYVFAYILALKRQVLESRENQLKRHWKELPAGSLRGGYLGICGVGAIGGHIAKIGQSFGMTVWGIRRSGKAHPFVDRMFAPAQFDAFLSGPDYLVVTLPLTPETVHLFDTRAFEQMKPSSVLINVGRGAVVGEKALIDALKGKRIRGAVLDVFETEPLPKESPLWDMDNVLVTAHQSAHSFPEDVADIFCENYGRFLAGEPLAHEVNFKRGY
ncbi:MAG: D-2-hydroxyacid dehydrogenase [Deltaproteobacteria bacterium]